MNLEKEIKRELSYYGINYNSKSIEQSPPWQKKIEIINRIEGLSDKKRFYKKVSVDKISRDRGYFKYCVENIDKELLKSGLWLEMGVYKGYYAKIIIEERNNQYPLIKNHDYIGFDCFEGLPEFWKPGFEAGTFKVNELPVHENLRLEVGLFKDTLPNFYKKNKEKKICFLHVDCDLYSSTKEVFQNLGSMLSVGTVILLDEVIGEELHYEGEYKAFKEFLKDNNIEIEWLAFVANAGQAACKITKIGV